MLGLLYLLLINRKSAARLAVFMRSNHMPPRLGSSDRVWQVL